MPMYFLKFLGLNRTFFFKNYNKNTESIVTIIVVSYIFPFYCCFRMAAVNRAMNVLVLR